MKISNSLRFSGFKAFSLVEMLIVIAVIGIVAAIAIPNLSRINGSAGESAARRNAQNIASLSSSANAAGAYHVIPEVLGGGVAMSVEVLSKGVQAPDIDMEFLMKMGPEQIEHAAEFLSITKMGNEFVLVYNAEPEVD